MASTRIVSITLPHEQLSQLDSVATDERRSRSNLVSIAVDEFLARHRVAGQQRLAELERLAQETLARPQASDSGSRAAADHLAEHRRLSGFATEQENP